ncbi:aminoglycoside phosphotransferase family protein [Deinococcus psychrotolerans]|uniref:Aminoglycoside phosphotransferase family protein n=1 Tax=Deinococcus psychrotolerans TaxID=2489213 RepID=A0A3G8YCI6_9DEIO|nr:aminoglycoside phosphotransferase family protein [Deinococcus psychrotolerans]AZI42640.1 aminoglycoside phosphotransferase family protein [Deinococcus psychrotolerans]
MMCAVQRVSLFPNLEQLYGPLTPLDFGMQSRVYTDASRERVLKIYRNHKGEHRTEAANMRRADMGQWVLNVHETDGVEVLVMPRFDGHPLSEADVLRALPRVRQILEALHAERRGQVDLPRLSERLKRFRSALAPYPLDDLFEAIEEPLFRGALDVPAAFCHLDLWQDNILINDATGEVLVIDWTKAAWDDPMRDLALLKTGTLDLLSRPESLAAALELVPPDLSSLTRFRAYLAHSYLHDLYWFLMNEPYEFEAQREVKVRRARHALLHLI